MQSSDELTDGLTVAHDDYVTIITINRPQRRNALDRKTARALADTLNGFDTDPKSRVAVLSGAGGHFCAGADLKELAAGDMYVPWGGDPNGPCHVQLSKPTIAAVEGYACAGGLGIALRCDLRVAGQGAVFAVLSRRWGVPMSDGTTVRLPQLIGRGRALDMLLTARMVHADEASQIGLADRLVPQGDALSEAISLAHDIAAFPQAAVLADRASLYAGLDLPLAQALAMETRISDSARDKDAQSGASRFAAGAGRHGDSAG